MDCLEKSLIFKKIKLIHYISAVVASIGTASIITIMGNIGILIMITTLAGIITFSTIPFLED